MFGNDSRPTRIYSCAVKAFATDADERLALDQSRLAHRYKQTLIALEHDRRVDVDRVITELSPEFAAAKTANTDTIQTVDFLYQALRSRRQHVRQRVAATADEMVAIETAKVVRRESFTALMDVRKRVVKQSDIALAIEAANAEHHRRTLAAGDWPANNGDSTGGPIFESKRP